MGLGAFTWWFSAVLAILIVLISVLRGKARLVVVLILVGVAAALVAWGLYAKYRHDLRTEDMQSFYSECAGPVLKGLKRFREDGGDIFGVTDIEGPEFVKHLKTKSATRCVMSGKKLQVAPWRLDGREGIVIFCSAPVHGYGYHTALVIEKATLQYRVGRLIDIVREEDGGVSISEFEPVFPPGTVDEQ